MTTDRSRTPHTDKKRLGCHYERRGAFFFQHRARIGLLHSTNSLFVNTLTRFTHNLLCFATLGALCCPGCDIETQVFPGAEPISSDRALRVLRTPITSAMKSFPTLCTLRAMRQPWLSDLLLFFLEAMGCFGFAFRGFAFEPSKVSAQLFWSRVKVIGTSRPSLYWSQKRIACRRERSLGSPHSQDTVDGPGGAE